MSDLESLSDEELLSQLSDEDLAAEAAKHGLDLGMISRTPVLSAVAAIGKATDPYTGAPTRAALKGAITGTGAASEFSRQFGRPTSESPTGKEIAALLGASEKGLSEYAPSLYSETGEGLPLQRGGAFDISPADIAGLGIDVVTDWTNLIGSGAIARNLAKPAAKTTVSVAKKVPGAIAGAADLAMMQSPARVMRGETAARKAVSSVGERAGQAMSAVDRVVNPRQVQDYDRMARIAKEAGISPSDLPAAVEFGPSSFISRAERSVMEGPAGEAKLEKFYESARKVDDAVRKTITGGKPTVSLDEAGRRFIDSFNGAVSSTLDNADITYKKVQKYAPGLMIDREEQAALNSAMAGIEKRAKGLIQRGITNTDKEQGRQLLRAVEGVRRTKGSFKQTVEALDMIGKSAFKKQYDIVGDVPPLTSELQGLYFDARKAIINTVDKHVSKDFAQELVQNNKIISDLIKNEKQISSAISASTPNEKRLSQLFADTSRIESVKKILPPEQFNQVASDYVMSVIPKNAEGMIQPGQMRNWLRKEEPKLRAMLPADQYKKLEELSEFGHRFGSAVLSTSGTGASNSFRNVIEGVFNGQVTDSVIESMKTRARKSALPKPKAFEQIMTEVNAMVPAVSQPKRMLGARENQLAQFLKGSQVIGVQGETQDRRKRRLKALEGK